MATYIRYVEGATITYNSQQYEQSLSLAFTNYKLDKFGRKVDDGNDDLAVRSYYTVNGVDPGPKGVDGRPLTIEDLVTLLTVKRANILEKEITPMAKIIDERNQKIETLGTWLAAVAKAQSELESKDEDHQSDSVTCSGICNFLNNSGIFTAQELQNANLNGWTDDKSAKTDGRIASANQLIKAKIDALNNDAQSDLSRMDNLVSKRDEAYTLSTDLLSKFSDGRSGILNNMK